MFRTAGLPTPAHGLGAPPPPTLALTSEIGYGIPLPRGVLLFSGDHRRDAWGVSERVGLAWESLLGAQSGSDIRLTLDWHPTTATAAAGYGFEATWERRF